MFPLSLETLSSHQQYSLILFSTELSILSFLSSYEALFRRIYVYLLEPISKSSKTNKFSKTGNSKIIQKQKLNPFYSYHLHEPKEVAATIAVLFEK